MKLPGARLASPVPCLLALFLVTGCRHKAERLAGGGGDEVTGVLILAKENKTLLKEQNPTTLRAGESLPLRVVASWAIPYVGDVTGKTLLAVSDPAIGVLDEHGTFVAKKPGRVTIDASIRVTAQGHKILSLQEPSGSDPVVTLRDQMVLNITE